MSAAIFQRDKRNLKEISVQGNKNFVILKMQLCDKHQHDYWLNDGCFHKNLGIHLTTAVQVTRRNQHLKKHDFFLF